MHLKTGFNRVGECNRCGVCCMSLLHWDKLGDERRAFLRKFDPSAEVILRRVERGSCPNLRFRGSRATCAIYVFRPRFCREFPNHPENLIEECSFRLVPENEVKP